MARWEEEGSVELNEMGIEADWMGQSCPSGGNWVHGTQ